MTLAEAKKVLGLGPNENVEGHVEELLAARERIAEMVRSAPNDTIALRYQDGLLEFDKALAAVREDLERGRRAKVAPLMALVPHSVTGETPVVREKLKEEVPAEVEGVSEGSLEEVSEPVAGEEAGESGAAEEISQAVEEPDGIEVEAALPVKSEQRVEEKEAVKPTERLEERVEEPEAGLEPVGSGAGVRWIGYLLLFAIVGGVGGGWLYFYVQQEKRVRTQEQLAVLEGLGAKLVENRRWGGAEETYSKMEELEPDSEVAALGRLSIAEGKREEQEQFVGYWSGEAVAAFEAGRLEDAREAATKVLDRYKDEEGVSELLAKIESARVVQIRDQWVTKAREAMAARDWQAAEMAVSSLTLELPNEAVLAVLAGEIQAGMEKERRNLARAGELAAAAKVRDAGKFDHQALEWLREAVALAPKDEEIAALYEKMASYTRTLRVPEEVGTLEEALKQVRDNDRIVLGEGTWPGAIVINAAVKLEGAGGEKTLIECPATKGPAVTFGPGAKGATVAGIRFRQSGFDAGESRYPGVLVRGAEIEFSDCSFFDASGHGLAVQEGAVVTALRCRFVGNGWDGLAVRGDGSRLVAKECEANGNFGHGFDVWDGAMAVILESEAKGNSRNGILIDSAAEELELSGNVLSGNREYGLVLGAGSSGKVLENQSRENLLGGLVVRFSAISVRVEQNRIEKNQGPGLILEQGLREDIYGKNRTVSNRGRDVMVGVKFSGRE